MALIYSVAVLVSAHNLKNYDIQQLAARCFLFFINGKSTLEMVLMQLLSFTTICVICKLFCLLDKLCVDRNINSTARVGLVGWNCCQRERKWPV